MILQILFTKIEKYQFRAAATLAQVCFFSSSFFFFTYTNVYLVQQMGPPALQMQVGGLFSFILPIQYTLHDPHTPPSLQMRVSGVVFFHNSYSVQPTQQTGLPLLQTWVGRLFSLFSTPYTTNGPTLATKVSQQAVIRQQQTHENGPKQHWTCCLGH